MFTNRASLVVFFFLFGYERDFVWCLFLMINKLIPLTLLTLFPDIWMDIKYCKSNIPF